MYVNISFSTTQHDPRGAELTSLFFAAVNSKRWFLDLLYTCQIPDDRFILSGAEFLFYLVCIWAPRTLNRTAVNSITAVGLPHETFCYCLYMESTRKLRNAAIVLTENNKREISKCLYAKLLIEQ